MGGDFIKHKEKLIGGFILLIIITIFLSVGYINTKPEKLTEEDMKKMFIDNNKKEENKSEENKNVEKSSNKEKITVEIKGEVNNPNVYILDEGSRIYELIEKAGGITTEGNLNSINRASTLTDGQCVIICNINNNNSEISLQDGNLTSGLGISEKNNAKININKAAKDELTSLSGIGDAKADAIIAYREKLGGFKKIEDLKNVEGIGEKTVEKLKDKISVG